MVNLIYTHSSYFDVLDSTFNLHKSRCPVKDFIFISDKPYKSYRTIIYNNRDSYFQRMAKSIVNVDAQSVIFQHEDMPLYAKPDCECFSEVVESLDKYDYIRLARTGKVEISGSKICEITSRECFVIQPTAWRTEKIKKLFSQSFDYTMFDCETRLYLDSFNGAVWYDGEQAIGGHFRSKCWPYVATAIVKGKWNCSEYNSEIKGFRFDTSRRGEI